MRALLPLLLLTLTAETQQAHAMEVDKERTIEIAGIVDSPSILHAADRVYGLSKSSIKPIYLLINSPGGSVYAGLQFVNAMEVAKERGVKFICAVPGMAMSMAFQIFLYCDERYALPHALLLWHPVRISGFVTLTPQVAKSYSDDLADIEDLLLDPLKEVITSYGMRPSDFRRHYLKETTWTAKQLDGQIFHFLTVVKDIPALTGVWTTGDMTNIFGRSVYKTTPGDIFYIHEKYTDGGDK